MWQNIFMLQSFGMENIKNRIIISAVVILVVSFAVIYFSTNNSKKVEGPIISQFGPNEGDEKEGAPVFTWQSFSANTPVNFVVEFSRDNGKTWDSSYSSTIHCNGIDAMGTVAHPAPGSNGMHRLACNFGEYTPHFKGQILARLTATDILGNVSVTQSVVAIDTALSEN